MITSIIRSYISVGHCTGYSFVLQVIPYQPRITTELGPRTSADQIVRSGFAAALGDLQEKSLDGGNFPKPQACIRQTCGGSTFQWLHIVRIRGH